MLIKIQNNASDTFKQCHVTDTVTVKTRGEFLLACHVIRPLRGIYKSEHKEDFEITKRILNFVKIS